MVAKSFKLRGRYITKQELTVTAVDTSACKCPTVNVSVKKEELCKQELFIEVM